MSGKNDSLDDLNKTNLAYAKTLALVDPTSLTREQASYQKDLESKLEEIERIKSGGRDDDPDDRGGVPSGTDVGPGGDTGPGGGSTACQTPVVKEANVQSDYHEPNSADQANLEAALWEEEEQKQKSAQQERDQQKADLAEAKQRDEDSQDLTSDDSQGLPPGFSDRESDQNHLPPGYSDHGSDLQNLPPGFSDRESESQSLPAGFSDPEADSGTPQGGITERNDFDGASAPPGYGVNDSPDSVSAGGVIENTEVEDGNVVGAEGPLSSSLAVEVAGSHSAWEPSSLEEAPTTSHETLASEVVETTPSSESYFQDVVGPSSAKAPDQLWTQYVTETTPSSESYFQDVVGPSSAKAPDQLWTQYVTGQEADIGGSEATVPTSPPVDVVIETPVPTPAIEPAPQPAAPQPAPAPVVIP